jgi:ferredoxin
MPVLVDIEKCTGCGICVPLCSEKAITIIENKAVIEDNSCNECLQCMDECPPNAIYQIIDSKSPVTKREDSLASKKFFK